MAEELSKRSRKVGMTGCGMAGLAAGAVSAIWVPSVFSKDDFCFVLYFENKTKQS